MGTVVSGQGTETVEVEIASDAVGTIAVEVKDSATPPCRAVARFEVCVITCDFISTLVSSPPAGQTGPYVYECQASVSQGTGPFTYQWSPSPQTLVEPDGRIVRISLPDNTRRNIDLTVVDNTKCQAMKTHRVGAISYTLEADPDDGGGILRGERENANFEVQLTATANETVPSPAPALVLEFRRLAPTPDEVYELTLFLENGSSPTKYKGTWSAVTTMKGKWDIKVVNGNSNTLNFKIDKRQQIVQLANYWAGLNAPVDFLPGEAGCDGFVDHIYTKVGLPKMGLNWNIAAPDSGDGALRFFQKWRGPALTPPPFTTATHVAIQNGGSQIDNNWGTSVQGPTVRQFDAGVRGPLALEAQYWDNAISGAPVDPASGQSLLVALEAE